jgi:hypothetical protein
MSREVKFRINVPTIALFTEDGRQVARRIPVGSEIRVDETAIEDNKLIEVRWIATTVMMFSQDIRARGEKIGSSR